MLSSNQSRIALTLIFVAIIAGLAGVIAVMARYSINQPAETRPLAPSISTATGQR